MLQRALSQVLLKYVQKYIRNLDAHLELSSLWSGEVVIRDVDIEAHAVQEALGASPVAMISGSIKELRVEIPWASLTSNPIKCTCVGLRLNLSSDPEQVSRSRSPSPTSASSSLHEQLERLDENEDEDKELSNVERKWSDGILGKILANLVLVVEDTIMQIGGAKGDRLTLSCSSFKLQTANEEWNVEYSVCR